MPILILSRDSSRTKLLLYCLAVTLMMALYIYSMYRFMQFYTRTYGEDDEAAEEGSYGSGLGSITSRSGSSAT